MNIELRMWWWRIQHAAHTIRFPWRASFLIVALVPTLNVSWVYVAFILVGYHVFNFVEHLAKEKVFDDAQEAELGWKDDPEDPESEEKDGLSRVKLSSQNKNVIFGTVDLIRRML